MKKEIAMAALLLPCTVPVLAQQAGPAEVTVLAAGSLREAMTEVGEAYRSESGIGISASYGPSGKLREDMEKGRKADVFASAAVEHTGVLAAKKLLSRSVTLPTTTCASYRRRR